MTLDEWKQKCLHLRPDLEFILDEDTEATKAMIGPDPRSDTLGVYMPGILASLWCHTKNDFILFSFDVHEDRDSGRLAK
jgi:hypothetical protein